MDISLDTCGRTAVTCLLLLHLFVLKAAADCPKPQGGGIIVLTDEALLLNDFPDGLQVTLECGTGYDKESGSGTTTCVNGNWTEPDLKCKKKDCGLPKPQPHMSFNTSAGTLYGDEIRVICDKGFRISGSSFKQCLLPGWIGRATCVIVKCGKPAKVANGKSLWDSQDDPKYGEIVQYVCNPGYSLVGRDSLMCSETGKYNSQPPTCEDVTTEDTVTTEMATSTSPTQEASTSTASPATPTAHRDNTVTASSTPTVSPTPPGGRGILTAGGRATTTSVTSMTTSSFQDQKDGDVDTNQDVGYMPLIVSVICVTLVVCILALVLHKFLLRRKGSYDTREDLKPELLQFQNL